MKITVDTLEHELTIELDRFEKLNVDLTVGDMGFTMIALVKELAAQLDVDVEVVRDLVMGFIDCTPVE